MQKATYCLGIVLICCGGLLAQTDQPDCVCVSDIGCVDDDCTTSTASSCSNTTYLAATSGVYVFKVFTECTEGQCYGCQSCADLSLGAQHVMNCHTNDCDAEDCEEQCQVNLTANNQYSLRVCLIPCPNVDCDECGDDCKAWACLYPLTWPSSCP